MLKKAGSILSGKEEVIMRLECVIWKHYCRPSCNELIIEVSLVCAMDYDNKTRITISYPNRFSYTAHSIFHSNSNVSLLWQSKKGVGYLCVCKCVSDCIS